MTVTDRNSPEGWLAHTRSKLLWLLDDGYDETRVRVLRSRVHLRFAGPHGQISITIDPSMSEIEIWLRPPDGSGHGPAMWEYLKARGLAVPRREVIDPKSAASVEAAIDAHAEALKQLRHKELAGDWTRLDRAAGLAASQRRRTQLIDDLVTRARLESEGPDN